MTTIKMNNPTLSSLLLPLIAVLLVLSSVRSEEQSSSSSSSSSLRGLVNTNELLPTKTLRIIGGGKSELGRFPYYAIMNGESLCGAVLISSRFVLTAAHCRDADKDFAIGPSKFSGGIESLIVNRTVHPLYDDFTYNNDIALFELADDITDIQYVKLERTEINEPGQAMTVIGFGDTNPAEKETDFADYLHQVDVNYVSSDICRRAHRGEIDDDMLCAEAPNKDACYGDSGGPLLLTPNDNSNDDRLVGIVSWGRGCADEEYPGVYSRISYFYDWIVKTMCTMNADGVPDYVDCNEIIGIADNRDEDFSLTGSNINTTVPTTESPTPNPVTPPPIETCGNRGAMCTKVDDCCSKRCNFGTGTCYPKSTSGRDKISNGMGGSAGGGPARRNGILGGGLGLQLP